jgi:hypothetical protein
MYQKVKMLSIFFKIKLITSNKLNFNLDKDDNGKEENIFTYILSFFSRKKLKKQ